MIDDDGLPYLILWKRTRRELEIEVEKYLLDGWELQGGVTTAPVSPGAEYYCDWAQAIVNPKELRTFK